MKQHQFSRSYSWGQLPSTAVNAADVRMPLYANCRIVYLVGQLGCGGLERQLCYLLQMLVRHRHAPQLVIWNSTDDEFYNSAIRELGIITHRFDVGVTRVVKLLRLRQLVRRLRPEVIHSFDFYTNFAAWWAAQGTHALAVGSVRSNFEEGKRACGAVVGRLSARWPRAQVFNSRAAAGSVKAAGGFFAPSQCYVVQNGVDCERFRYASPPSGVHPRILGIGSLLPVKRWDRLIRAAHRLAQEGAQFDIQIVGDGPLREALQDQIRMSGLSDRVKLLGYRSDIPELLATAHFLAHTSDSEGSPNVVAEAMAGGRPVIATNTGDVGVLVEDGRTGFLVPRDDEEALIDRMRTLLTQPGVCIQMGKAACSKAEQELGLDQLLNETLRVYRSLGWRG